MMHKYPEYRGGKREGAGRKRQGVTKKVSLTLSEELWNEIKGFDGTVSDYIRSLKGNKIDKTDTVEEVEQLSLFQEDLKKVTFFKETKEENNELTKEYVERYWEIYKQDFLLSDSGEKISEKAIEDAYKSLIHLMFQGEETVQLETSQRYRSQYSGKWFSSISNLLKAEVPRLISNAETTIQRKKENAEKRKKNEELERMSRKNLHGSLSADKIDFDAPILVTEDEVF